MNEREESIRRRAYEIWEQEGRPHGQEMEHWLRAFKEFGEQADGTVRISKRSTAKAKAAKPRVETKSAAEKQPARKTKVAQIALTAAPEEKPRRGRSTKSVTTH